MWRIRGSCPQKPPQGGFVLFTKMRGKTVFSDLADLLWGPSAPGQALMERRTPAPPTIGALALGLNPIPGLLSLDRILTRLRSSAPLDSGRQRAAPSALCFESVRGRPHFDTRLPFAPISYLNKTLARSLVKCILDLLPQCRANKVRMRGSFWKKGRGKLTPEMRFLENAPHAPNAHHNLAAVSRHIGYPSSLHRGCSGRSPLLCRSAVGAALCRPESRGADERPSGGGAGVLPSIRACPGAEPPYKNYQV